MKYVFAILLCMITPSAFATTQCLLVDSNDVTCTGNSKEKLIDWNTECNTWDYWEFTARGIGVCGSTVAIQDETATRIDISSTKADNIYCWCKMTVPAESIWVLRAIYNINENELCEQRCGWNCSKGMTDWKPFRKAIFDSVGTPIPWD